MNSSVLLEAIEKTLCVMQCEESRENRKAAINPGAKPWPRAPALRPSRLFTVRRPGVCPASAGVLLEGCLNKNLTASLDRDTNQTVAETTFIFLVDS